jgi:hypothetical protein
MAKNDTLTLDELRQTFDYDPDTGQFVWKWRDDVGLQWNRKNAGKIAGHVSVKGHVHLMINKRRFYAHRLAWLYMTGTYPSEDVDHINGVKSDNRFSNLREASRTENNYNRKIQRNNKVGVKGVYPHKDRFKSQLVVDGKIKHIGVFKTVEEAQAAYQEAVKKYHGKFAYSERA